MFFFHLYIITNLVYSIYLCKPKNGLKLFPSLKWSTKNRKLCNSLEYGKISVSKKLRHPKKKSDQKKSNQFWLYDVHPNRSMPCITSSHFLFLYRMLCIRLSDKKTFCQWTQSKFMDKRIWSNDFHSVRTFQRLIFLLLLTYIALFIYLNNSILWNSIQY